MDVQAHAAPKKIGYWRIVWQQYRRSTRAMVALAIIAFLMAVAAAAPLLANEAPIYMVKGGTTYVLPHYIHYRDLVNFDFKEWQPGEGDYALRPVVPYSPKSQYLLRSKQGPSKQHWLGTDDRGRDVLSRMIWGTRVSMSIGFVAVGISVSIGVVLGAIAGYYRGWVDEAVQRVIEIMLCFPTFFLILAVIAFLPPNILTLMAVIGVTGWMGVARLVRGEFLKLREAEFTIAATATGLRDTRVMFRHMLPNALAPVLVSAAFGVAGAILTESGLSFLGFGVQPPEPSWGELLKQSQRLLVINAWWLVIFPGLAIFITVTAFNLVGEGLRDAMDPRLRE
jgi:peptide/nickel transport system permease protein